MIQQAFKSIATMAALAISVSMILSETTSAGDVNMGALVEEATVAAAPVQVLSAPESSFSVTRINDGGEIKFVSTVN